MHGACLGKWLKAQAPMGVSRTCDVCRSPWKVVREPTVGRFVFEFVFEGYGAEAVRRLLRHVSEPRHVHVHWEDEVDDEDLGPEALGEEEEEEDVGDDPEGLEELGPWEDEDDAGWDDDGSAWNDDYWTSATPRLSTH